MENDESSPTVIFRQKERVFAQDKVRGWPSWTGDQRMERSVAGQAIVLTSQQSIADKLGRLAVVSGC